MTLSNKLPFVLTLCFGALLVYLFFFMPLKVREPFRCLNEIPLPLFGDNKSVSQEFRAPGPPVRIDILMANYKVKPEKGLLQLSLFQSSPSGDSRRLLVKNYPASTVEDNRFYAFDIDGKGLPAGRYRMDIRFLQANGKGDKLAVWMTEQNTYPPGDLYMNGNKIRGDMTFRVYYHSTIGREARQRLPKTVWAVALPLIMILLIYFFFYFAATLTQNHAAP